MVVTGGADVVVVGSDGVVVTVVVAVPDGGVSVAEVVVVASPGAGTAVTVVEVTVEVLVEVEAPVALAGDRTAQATRLPASPVAMVVSSGPGLPSTV